MLFTVVLLPTVALERVYRWPMPCTAGETAVVIDYDGNIRACELRGSLRNLRDYGCDFQAFWNSKVRADEINSIAQDKCFCTHICFLHDSMRFSVRVRFWELPLELFQSTISYSIQGILSYSFTLSSISLP